MAAAAADEAAEVDEEEEEDSGDPEQIAMLPSYKITEWGTIIWTFMDMHSGDVKKLQEKPIRKYDSKTGMNSAQWLPERWVRCCPRHHLNICFLVIHVNRHMSVGVLARGMLKEPLVHDQFCCSTELEGEKQIIDPVSKQPKTEKFKFMCKEPITPKNASTCCSERGGTWVEPQCGVNVIGRTGVLTVHRALLAAHITAQCFGLSGTPGSWPRHRRHWYRLGLSDFAKHSNQRHRWSLQ